MKKRLTLAGGAVELALLASGGTAKANLVVDGDFTAAPDPGTYTTYGVGTMGGWTVVSGSVDLIGTYWQAPPGGGRSVDMAGNENGTIQQTISGLTVGQNYQLSFAMSGNPDGPPGVKTLGVGLTIGGGSPITFTYTIGSNSHSDMQYQTETAVITATSTSEVLQFQDLSSGVDNPVGPPGTTPWGAVIGNVSLVPEPTTMVAGALLLLPFGASTLRALRRRTA